MKKFLVGLLIAAMVCVGGTAIAGFDEGILYEFRERSVVVFPHQDGYATGVNYSKGDADTVNRSNPYVGVFVQEPNGECTFYMTLMGYMPVYSGPLDCKWLPEVQLEPGMGHSFWIPTTDSYLVYSDKGFKDAQIHIDLFNEFVRDSYYEGQEGK